MIRVPTTSRRTVAALATVLLVGAALAATAGAAAAQSTHSASIGPAVAAQGGADYQLDVTKTYHRTPDDLGTVNVTMTIENPELVTAPGVRNVTVDGASLDNESPVRGLSSDGDSYYVTGDTDTAVIQYQTDLDATAEAETAEIAHVRPDNLPSWPCLNGFVSACGSGSIDVETDSGVEVEPAFAFEPARSGFVTSGNSPTVATLDSNSIEDAPYDPLVVLGNYRTHNASADGTDVTVVVPRGLELRESGDAIADSIADAAATVDVGADEGRRYVLALDEFQNSRDDSPAYTSPANARWVKYEDHLPIYNVFSAPVHEWAHTTDRLELSEYGNMTWYTEGYASYVAARVSLEQGYGDYDLYRNSIEEGRTIDNGYKRGTLILAGIDRRVRLATDGQRTLWHVVDRLHDRDGPIDETDLAAAVEAETNEPLAEQVRTWAREEELPSPIGREEYEAIYGPVPDPEYETTTVTTRSDRGTETVETDSPLAVRRGANVSVQLTVHNEGGAPATPRVSFRELALDPMNPDSVPTIYDETRVTVPGGGSETVTLSRRFDERVDQPVEVGPEFTENRSTRDRPSIADTYNLTVTDPEATIVREHGRHTSRDRPAIVTNATPELVFQAEAPRHHVYYDRNSWFETGPDGVASVDPGSWIQPNQTEMVRFGYYGERHYVSSLARVDGAVPTDPDGDGLYEDLDSDGQIDDNDAQVLFEHTDDPAVTKFVPAYDFDDDGDVDNADAQALYQEAQ